MDVSHHVTDWQPLVEVWFNEHLPFSLFLCTKTTIEKVQGSVTNKSDHVNVITSATPRQFFWSSILLSNTALKIAFGLEIAWNQLGYHQLWHWTAMYMPTMSFITGIGLCSNIWKLRFSCKHNWKMYMKAKKTDWEFYLIETLVHQTCNFIYLSWIWSQSESFTFWTSSHCKMVHLALQSKELRINFLINTIRLL